ncbi:hypothetical protein JCM3770_001391 [Rhodotorula araucariae]
MAKLAFDCVLVPTHRRRTAAPPSPSPRPPKRDSATAPPAESTVQQRPFRLRTLVKVDEPAESDSSRSTLARSDDEAAERELELQDHDDDDSDSSAPLEEDGEEPKPKRSRTASPVAIKVEQPEVRIKLEDGEEEEKVFPPSKGPRTYPRPDILSSPDYNIYMGTTIPEELGRNDEGVAHMAALGGFKREDLGGPLQGTSWHIEYTKVNKRTGQAILDKQTNEPCWAKGSRPRAYEVYRLNPKASLNFGCRGPGQPFVLTKAVHEVNEDAPEYAVWMRDKGDGKEPWRPYGIYKNVWCGRAHDGEFNPLESIPGGKEAQEDAVAAFTEYLRSVNPTEFIRSVFKYTTGVLKEGQTAEEFLWSNRTKGDPELLRKAIRRALSENNSLNVGYAVNAYVRPISDVDLQACVELRALRRDRDDTAEATKLARDAHTKALSQMAGCAADDAAAARVVVDDALEELGDALERAAAALAALEAEKARRAIAAKEEAKEYALKQGEKKKAFLAARKQAEEKAAKAEREKVAQSVGVKPERKDEEA